MRLDNLGLRISQIENFRAPGMRGSSSEVSFITNPALASCIVLFYTPKPSSNL